jgi:flagellum-specific peptidoglycan hydrolase FlgJ
MRRYGILASVTIAQAALESGWGAYAKGNNLFGIKGTGQIRETREYINHHWITIVDGFRVYDSWEGSIQDHSQFLLQNSRYAPVIGQRDYRVASNTLQQGGYATDPEYAGKLIRIIEQHGLIRYDQEVWVEQDAARDVWMEAEDADKVIAFLAAGWFAVEAEDAKAEFHRLANELRRVSGQPLP